jgi:hypothetical protein
MAYRGHGITAPHIIVLGTGVIPRYVVLIFLCEVLFLHFVLHDCFVVIDRLFFHLTYYFIWLRSSIDTCIMYMYTHKPIQWRYLVTVPLGVGNSATDAVIADSGNAMSCRRVQPPHFAFDNSALYEQCGVDICVMTWFAVVIYGTLILVEHIRSLQTGSCFYQIHVFYLGLL